MVSNGVNFGYPQQYPQQYLQGYYNPSMQASGVPPQQGPQNPAMQGGTQDQLQDNPMVRMFAGDESPEDRRMSTLLIAPMMLGLYKTMDGFARANNGVYEKSLVGRLARLGDKISASKAFNPVRSVGNFIKSKGSALIGKSKILTAITKMPTIPENAMAKGMLHGTKEEIVSEFTSLVDKHIKQGGALGDFKYKAGSKMISLSEGSLETLRKFADAAPGRKKVLLDRVLNICENSGEQTAAFDKLLGPLSKRTVSTSQVANKIKAVTKSSSTLGRLLPKISIRGLHGLTFGGGIFMLMSAISLAKAAVKTKNAEKGDKFKTFMEEFLGNISWVVTMPLGCKIMNAFQGMKNIGMSPAKLKAYRQALKVHNSTVFANKAAWQASRNALNALWSPDKVGFFGRICRGIGKLFSTGREVVKPFINPSAASAGEKLANIAAKTRFKGLNLLAFPIGLATYMFIFSPIADKIFVKASHALFGKPKHSRYDEDKEPVKDPSMTGQPPEAQQPQAGYDQPVVHTSPTNLINMHQNGIPYNPNNPGHAHSSSTSVVHAPADGDKVLEPVRTYIPSPACTIKGWEDPTAANDAIARSQAAEKRALEVLAMKF